MTNSFTGHNSGQVFQARDVHGDVLFTNSAPQALAGLPRATSTFLGRDHELDLLRNVRCVVVSGLAGVGKTQLVLHVAHRAKRPGGELFVDLRGYDENLATSPAEALDKFLRDLGVAGEHIPPEVDQRAALYRSVLAKSEPMLIVLDNASSAAQVEPLLPGTSTHRVLITSRNVLTGLDDAEHVVLGSLADADAAELVGDSELASLCGNLPLALRIMAALRKHHPEVDWVTELRRTDPLEVLDDGDTRRVHAAFDLSYRFLKPAERRLFRLLALHPGDEIFEVGAGALADLPPARTAALIRGLLRAHLLERGPAPDTYRFHDLVRLYSRRCLADEADDDREAAVTRVLDHYLAEAEAGCRALGLMEDNGSDAADWVQTLSCLDRIRPTLVAAVAVAADLDRHDSVYRFALALSGYLFHRRRWHDQVVVTELGVRSARALGDRSKAGPMHETLGRALCGLHEHDQAKHHLAQALAISQACRDRSAEARVWKLQGTVHTRCREFGDAIDCFRQALSISDELGDRTSRAHTESEIARTHLMMGDLSEAAAIYERQLPFYRHVGAATIEAFVLNQLGTIHAMLGNPDEALRRLREGQVVSRSLDDEYATAAAAMQIGTVHLQLGEFPEAEAAFQSALEGFEADGTTDHELRKLLAQLRDEQR